MFLLKFISLVAPLGFLQLGPHALRFLPSGQGPLHPAGQPVAHHHNQPRPCQTVPQVVTLHVRTVCDFEIVFLSSLRLEEGVALTPVFVHFLPRRCFCPSRRSFHSLEQLSADVSLNSDSQRTDGRLNGDAGWTSAGKVIF